MVLFFFSPRHHKKSIDSFTIVVPHSEVGGGLNDPGHHCADPCVDSGIPRVTATPSHTYDANLETSLISSSENVFFLVPPVCVFPPLGQKLAPLSHLCRRPPLRKVPNIEAEKKTFTWCVAAHLKGVHREVKTPHLFPTHIIGYQLHLIKNISSDFYYWSPQPHEDSFLV